MKVVCLKICRNYTLVLSDYIIDELYYVIENKFKKKKKIISKFSSRISYEIVNGGKIEDYDFKIRDIKDIPILYYAIKGKIDVFITGDKDFQNVEIIKPIIMTPREFFDEYLYYKKLYAF